MFPKYHRINSRIFTRIFKTGKKYFSPYFRCIQLSSKNFSVAVVIPKKIIPKRINRNREKRRILHVLKKIYSRINIDNGSYIFWIQKDTTNLSALEIEHNLKLLIKQTYS